MTSLDDPEHFDLPASGRDRSPTEKFIAQVKGMLVGDEYEYAEDTLRGILTTVERTGRVSEGQERAVGNIAANPGRKGSQGHRSQRWYGG